MSGCAEEQIIKWHAEECDDQATQVACGGVRRREDNTGGMRRSATTTRQHRWHAECDDEKTTQVACRGKRRRPGNTNEPRVSLEGIAMRIQNGGMIQINNKDDPSPFALVGGGGRFGGRFGGRVWW